MTNICLYVYAIVAVLLWIIYGAYCIAKEGTLDFQMVVLILVWPVSVGFSALVVILYLIQRIVARLMFKKDLPKFLDGLLDLYIKD